jgi:hypothetical protein
MERNDTQDMITGWEKQKAILKVKFKRLTDADLNFEENRKNEMLARLALKLGMTSHEIRSIISRATI